MRVAESGHDHTAAQILNDRVLIRKVEDVCAATGSDELPIANGQGLRIGRLGIKCMNKAIGENAIGHRVNR